MPVDLADLADLTEEELSHFSIEEIEALLSDVSQARAEERRQNPILYYEPASPEARKVHLSTAKEQFITGGNRCLPLDAPVLMGDCSWKPLGDIDVGDIVMGADPITGETLPVPVTATHRSGRRLVYEVMFSDGGSFQASAEHYVPMYLGSGRKTTKGNQKLPHKRRLGDYLEAILRRGGKNPAKRIAAVSPFDIRGADHQMPTINPYLLGAMLGDGSLHRSLKFHNTDERVLSEIRHIVDFYDCDLVDYGHIEHGITSRIGRKNLLTDKFRDLGLFGTNSYSKFIPKECYSWDRFDRKQLLAGLIDTDGTRDWYTTCSVELANGFVHLVKSLGGKAILRNRVSRSQNGTAVNCISIYWRLNERLPLAIPEKQAINSKREVDYRRRVCRRTWCVGVRDCGDITVSHPAHCFITGDYVIVSNSSKTETSLAELVIQMTGIVPASLKDDYPREKIRQPIRARLCCVSHTNTWEQVLRPKLDYTRWSGREPRGGPNGHWGWIPPDFLRGKSWEKSWSEKYRTLTLTNGSTLQVMSYDQDVEDFAGSSLHLILHDEGPKQAIYRENKLRTADVGGRLMIAMTPPDEEGAAWDAAWCYDELYEKGQGPRKDPDIDAFTLFTVDNKTLDQVEIERVFKGLSPKEREVRGKGKFLHLTGLIYPMYTSDRTDWWCFHCNDTAAVTDGTCITCGSTDVVTFCHMVEPFEQAYQWPTVFVIDPHPRKPNMMSWIAVDPSDDYWQVAELSLDREPEGVRDAVLELESAMRISVVQRLIDPNMGESPAHSAGRRETTVREEFQKVGLNCALADDAFDVGKNRLRMLLKPDPRTRQPRLHIFNTCHETDLHLKRYSWDEWARFSREQKDPKPRAREKYDDFPTILRYFANGEFTFRGLTQGGRAVKRAGRRGAY